MDTQHRDWIAIRRRLTVLETELAAGKERIAELEAEVDRLRAEALDCRVVGDRYAAPDVVRKAVKRRGQR